jgi:hypothetical protein
MSLAVIGNIFGVGCASADDLTHGGAAAWLAAIPSWARSDVCYHTTTFNDLQGCCWFDCVYDCCNLGSEPLLSE